MRFFTFLLGLGLALSACQGEVPVGDSPKVNEVRDAAPTNADLIQNPATADASAQQAQGEAAIEFEETRFHFGTVTAGEVVEHHFPFKNTGNAPLVITEASATCGCTVPERPQTPILPGESSEIRVQFNTEGRSGTQEKRITIVANTTPNRTNLYLQGSIQKAN